mmetsp:Transcript_10011/g.15004  ORF Transcript_10011/g.15004 Transcript_10011/m.15004 type:complete len:332 (-) Transcript_10011:227-1222(-)
MAAAATRQIPIVCPGHTRPLAELQFCAVDDEEEQRTFLVSACHDKMPMLRDGVSGDWIGTFKGHKGAVWSTKLDPSGYLAATASGDFSVKVWDAITGKNLYSFQHKHICKTIDFSPNSKLLATGGHEGLLRIYDLLSCQQVAAAQQNDEKGGGVSMEPKLVLTQSEEKIYITKCLWIDNEMVLVASSDGKIRVWNVVGAGSLSYTFEVADGAVEVRDMEIRAIDDGRTMLTVAAGDKVSLFDLNSKALVSSFKMPIHFREEGGASLHPSGSKFIAGGSDLWVRVFDTLSGTELDCLKGHHGPIRCLRYAPDGKTFATGSEDGTIRIWKTDA